MSIHDPMHAIVRVDHLLALVPFASSDNYRYYLKGVNIEAHQDGGAVMVATDGHTMACIHDADAYCGTQQSIWSTICIQGLKQAITSNKKAMKAAEAAGKATTSTKATAKANANAKAKSAETA